MVKAIKNPIEITYGVITVGGESAEFQLHGPYGYEKSPHALRVTFDVIVIGDPESTDPISDFYDNCILIEDGFAARDKSLTIVVDKDDTDVSYAYVAGSSFLNSVGSVTKIADPDTDRGLSRGYTVTIEAQVPTDDAGLRELEVTDLQDPSRRHSVTMRGIYATSGARAAYASNRDSEDPAILAAISGDYAWELVDESSSADRKDLVCTFSRTYEQLLMDQSVGLADNTNIRDHRVVFSEHTPAPGDAKKDIHRLRTVTASYDCSLDIDVVDFSSSNKGAQRKIYEGVMRELLMQAFVENFNPIIFTIEDQHVAYDETNARVSASITILYQKEKGEEVIELSESVSIRELRTIDYTPVFTGGEYDQVAAAGFALRERIATRTAVVIGTTLPRQRIGTGHTPAGKSEGEISGLESRGAFVTATTGWNLISNLSQVTPRLIGIPGIDFDSYEQIEVSVLDETVVERYHKTPRGSTGSGVQRP